MNKEAISKNCQKLISFCGDMTTSLDELMSAVDKTPEGLFHVYGKILDINNAPEFFGFPIFLEKEDYEEAKNWAQDKEKFFARNMSQESYERDKNMFDGHLVLAKESFLFYYGSHYFNVVLKMGA